MEGTARAQGAPLLHNTLYTLDASLRHSTFTISIMICEIDRLSLEQSRMPPVLP